MRLASFVPLLAVPVVACSEPESRIEPAQVGWMEWPAEVSVATPFTARLVGYNPSCAQVQRFVATPAVDQSAVTFEPYFLITGQPNYCRLDVMGSAPIDTASISIVAQFFDTKADVPGLEAEFSRTYEMRAGTNVSARNFLAGFPIRTFGDITVSTAQVENGRTNAGGTAYASRDSLGCVSLHPFGVFPGYVIENPPADTAQYWSAFVRGYIYDAPAPVCGESKVFHLVTRE